MRIAIEIARAQVQQKGKGEDACLVRRLDEKGMAQLLAVADGLSMSGGKAAAKWVINQLGKLTKLRKLTDVDTPRSIYTALKRALEESREVVQSETTLTCGILRQLSDGSEPFLRFEYFAIGDSPIWKVIPGDSKYPFQRFLVHGPLYPAETARVYSTLRLHKRDIRGSITFGVTEIALGEVLVVCTDGIPEREVFIRDLVRPTGVDPGRSGLCHWLFQRRKYRDVKLKGVLTAYNDRGILFDDATIIAARLGPVPTTAADMIRSAPDSHMDQESVIEPQNPISNTLEVENARSSTSDSLPHTLPEPSLNTINEGDINRSVSPAETTVETRIEGSDDGLFSETVDHTKEDQIHSEES